MTYTQLPVYLVYLANVFVLERCPFMFMVILEAVVYESVELYCVILYSI